MDASGCRKMTWVRDGELMHPETRYRICKSRANRASDTPLQSVCIPNFDKISAKISVLWSSTVIVAPIGVKFGILQIWHIPNFTPSVRRVAAAGEKPENRPLGNLSLYTGALRCAQWCP